jgi:hypothetical protein
MFCKRITHASAFFFSHLGCGERAVAVRVAQSEDATQSVAKQRSQSPLYQKKLKIKN